MIDNINLGEIEHTGQAAILYKRLGLSPIPVKLDKRPLIDWQRYQNEQATELEIRSWWANWPNAQIAIITGRTIDVIDIEKNYSKYFPNLKNLLTPKVKTKHNGIHYWIKSDNRKTTTINSNNIHLGDIKANGAYVLVPPSIDYNWIKGFEFSNIPLLDSLPNLERITLMGVDDFFLAQSKSPINVIPSESVGSRSEIDIADTIEFIYNGMLDEEIFSILLNRDSVIDREKKGHGKDYIRRTIDKGREWCKNHSSVVEIVKIDKVNENYVRIFFNSIEGIYKGKCFSMPLSWPVNIKSKNRWECLFSAVNIFNNSMDLLEGKKLRIEVVERNNCLRIGRFFSL